MNYSLAHLGKNINQGGTYQVLLCKDHPPGRCCSSVMLVPLGVPIQSILSPPNWIVTWPRVSHPAQLCFEWLSDVLLTSRYSVSITYVSDSPGKMRFDGDCAVGRESWESAWLVTALRAQVPGCPHWCQWVSIFSCTSCSTPVGVNSWVVFKEGLEPRIQVCNPNLCFKGSPLLKTSPPLWLMCGLWRAAPAVGWMQLLLRRWRGIC